MILPERFWQQVNMLGPITPSLGACWLWTGRLESSGYARIMIDGRLRQAHTLAWEESWGPVPTGNVLDHLCHTLAEACPGGVCIHRSCVNPAHLDPVTSRENTMRGRSLQAVNARKTHCPAGHPYTAENTRLNRHGSRVCRTCAGATRLPA